ncbi:MAG: polysaccharide deacetylase family protein [Candidatus Dormibacteraeota bacterium]|uniref:Polysaccharide deacetylase family protein n=1 Tax=Candidatus Amunia macphersoniae TaxID=3127014 RepID=A0A934KHN9_9BACT|nr:polysaccharide deacetylase family protein [Candidatus Dormibacteraeota bacterium]
MHPRTPRSPLDQQRPGDAPQAQLPKPAVVSVPLGPHLTVPILYYHYIRTIAPTPPNMLGFRLSIPPGLFAAQMALLHVEGAHTITLATLMAALAGKATLPPHPVVLTFDDGYADFATAAEPVLAQYGFVATDFVVSGFIGRPGYMTAAQVLAMDAAGVVIGSHTVHHTDLINVSLADARVEIDTGKAALEQLLGHPVLDFAYPYGGFNATVVQLIQGVGFRDAVSTVYGDTQTLSDRYLLHRTEIGGAPSLTTFARDAGLALPAPSQSTLIASLAAQTPATSG